ncbi:MAG: hypothetical protein ACTS27_06445 [Phycisphaerales bacterium]
MARTPGNAPDPLAPPAELAAVLRGAAGRLFLTRLLRWLVVSLAVACGVLVALLLAQRVFAFPVDWSLAWIIAGAGAVVFSLLVSALSSPDRHAVARTVDEAADLRESLSTALAVNRANDAWSRAAIDTARERARTVRLHAALPVRMPANWWVPFAPAALFALGWFLLPQWDALGAIRDREEKQAEQIELISAKEQAEAAERTVDAALRERGLDDLLEEQQPDAEAPEPTSPEAVRRSAIRKLTSVQEELTKLKESPENLAAEQMKERLSQLRQPGPGPLNEMVSKMQRGDLAGARDALEQLQRQLENNQLSPEQREALDQQMRNLAEQLNKLAEQNDELREALEKAGMNPDLANDLEALQKALEENPQNLTEQQKQQLQKMAQALSQSQSQCQNMGSMLGQGASGLGSLSNQLAGMASKAGQNNAANEALEDVKAQLAQLAQQGQQDGLSQFSKMFAKCQNCGSQCNGQGQCTNGSCPNGAGVGGTRTGVGHRIGTPEEHNETFKTNLEQAAGQGKDGPVIARSFVEGFQIRGESKAEFQAAAVAAETAAAEAIDDRRVPREHQDAIKRYFGRLKRAVEGSPASEPPAAPAPAAPDAGNN